MPARKVPVYQHIPNVRQLAVPNGDRKTQLSSHGLQVALILPVAMPMTMILSPCATNSGSFVKVVSIASDAVCSNSSSPPCPRCVPASGQFSPGMIHSISSADGSPSFISRAPSMGRSRKALTVTSISPCPVGKCLHLPIGAQSRENWLFEMPDMPIAFTRFIDGPGRDALEYRPPV